MPEITQLLALLRVHSNAAERFVLEVPILSLCLATGQNSGSTMQQIGGRRECLFAMPVRAGCSEPSLIIQAILTLRASILTAVRSACLPAIASAHHLLDGFQGM